MAGNSTLIAVKDRNWLNGFENLWRKESHGWWGTYTWLIQLLIWMAVVDGLLAVIVFTTPAGAEAQEFSGLTAYFLFSGLMAAGGVVIIAQEAIVDERKMGTAAWVLSKPISRVAFILAKLSAHALGILVSMVLAQGLVAYILLTTVEGASLSIPGFLAGVGLVYLALLFYLALTMMMGVLFRSRGPVVGIPLAVVFGGQFLASAPWLGQFTPSNLVMDMGPGHPALAVALAQGQPLTSVAPILGTAALTILFIVVAAWRFQREEF
jgi:ABC-2 type transport system permease protein